MKFIRSIVLVLISLAVSGTSFILHQNETDKMSKVEGGCPMSIKNAPYQVYIKFKGRYICGGALIAPNIVLTAAHCIDPFFKSKTILSVVAGTDNTKLYLGHSFFDKSVKIKAQQMKPYGRYYEKSPDSMYFDIGLIKLAKSFPITAKIKPIRLSQENVKLDDDLTVTGIGRLEADNEEMSSCLKYYKPKVVQCADQDKLNDYMKNAIICHEDYESGCRTHKGDSGGPVVNNNNELVGIHTTTVNVSERTYQVAVSVHHYMNWIRQTISEFTLPSILNIESNEIQ